ncbi:hypothetical protein VaNZ11_004587 [Volvox africanus]|uniref:DUF7798 domain-containing protein n=1 Tax=Volvox africanus TaxID=51714 RepID=A0ABQ5RWK1_9CHLO|nr:hypothetical protein VaNZ11_004587 [Volvox africanus]
MQDDSKDEQPDKLEVDGARILATELEPNLKLPTSVEPPSQGSASLAVPSSPSAEVPRATELSEITPAVSPTPPQRIITHQSYADQAKEYDDDEGEDSELLQEQRWQQQQQRQGSGAGWGGGWGSGWGLGALGGKLREVAAGAVRDVKDLTETFQAALADVTGAEDEVEQARRISEMDRAAEAEAAGVVEELDERAQLLQGSALPTDAPRQAAEPAREGALSGRGAMRAGGEGGVGGSAGGVLDLPIPPADPALEAGLQAIDAQVEQLATGAARAFSSLWGGLSTVAKVVAAEVAASVADVQSIEAVRGVAQIGTKLAHTAEKGLETVGRTAMVLLEEVTGVGAGHPGRRRIWGEEADARAADMGREPSSFQDFFYIYGGEQLAEEVNNLSNECAHLCNKSRSKLEGDQQQALDEALSSLGPYFNDPWVGEKAPELSGKEAGGASAPVITELDNEAAERLSHMYEPISYLCQDTTSRSEAFLHQLVEVVAGAQAAENATASLSKQTSNRPGGDAEDEEKVGEEEPSASLQRQRTEPQVLLDSFRAHFTKRLAEVTTAQLQLMLNLGASLAAPARTGRPAVDGIVWPESSEQQAALLVAEARRMVDDLQAITSAYAATLNTLRSLQPTAAEKSSSGVQVGAFAVDEVLAQPALEAKVLDEMAVALETNSKMAISTIKSGYKGLLYAVLLRGLVMQIAQQPEQAQSTAQLPAREGLEETAAVGGATEIVQMTNTAD